MEFWGVEVKAGEPLIVEPEDEMVIHLSQACLGESEGKSKEPVLIHVKVGDQKLVLGMLSSDKIPQLTFDLVFEKSFELSHNWKHGSIHFCGYQTGVGGIGEGDDYSDMEPSESEEDIVIAKPAVENGGQKNEQAKAKSVKGETSEKAKAKAKAPAGDEDDSSDDDEEDDSSDDGVNSDDSDEDMLGGDDSSDESDESDEDTPTPKPAPSKKRANDSAANTPVVSKKAKAGSPKSDGKKTGGHVATPHPSKKGGKTPATPTATTTDKSKPQTPKSAGVSCKTCSKTFGTEKGLESHTKAKHA